MNQDLEAQVEIRSDGEFSNVSGPTKVNESDDSSGRTVQLNAYAMEASTVPPFALEGIRKAKLKDTYNIQPVSMEQTAIKDPFLVSCDNNWSEFISNVQDKSAYGRRRHVAESHVELPDLDGAWEGENRLRGVFNDTYNDSDYDLSNAKERKQWLNYLLKIRNKYYGNVGKKEDFPVQEPKRQKSAWEAWTISFLQKKKYWMALERNRKQRLLPWMSEQMLKGQYVPLVCRFAIIVLSLISLGVSVRIYQNSDSPGIQADHPVPQQPSTIMAIIMNTLAVVYVCYIAYDEFSGKPLGLRSSFGKLKLIMLDLIFIIFSSANVSLAFNTMFDKQWVCVATLDRDFVPKIDYICRKQRALGSMLFLMLFVWVFTFGISIVRVVSKVAPLR